MKKTDFMQIMAERGFIDQVTHEDELQSKLASGRCVGYTGFDPTGDSLHIGHLLPVMMLRWFQKCGHKPLVILGGATARIGDPTGKDEARQVLTDEQITRNIDGIKSAYGKYLDFESGAANAALMLNNEDWLNEMGYMDFLRDYGRHFSINRMLGFESVKLRLEREQPLSFLEFNYMILQGYDFLELYRRHDCVVQFGGNDQWGNILNGVELTRRVESAQVFALTCPLITTASGEKMGKTVGGAVWLNADKCSPYTFWQYWRNTEDRDVGRFLKLYTELPLDEIARLEVLEGAEVNQAKEILADEVTTLAHGAEAARQARETARQTFAEGGAGEGLPSHQVTSAALQAGIPVLDLYCALELAKSKGEARRLIRQGGARINGQPLEDEEALIRPEDLGEDGEIKLSAGKKRHGLVRVIG